MELKNLNFTSAEMKKQQQDPTLVAIQTAAEGRASIAGVGFFKRDGLLYCCWTQPGSNVELEPVLPMQCMKPVLDL